MTVCEEISIYSAILSRTLGSILPQPKSNNRRVEGPKDISNANGQEQSTHFQGSQEEEFKATEKESGGGAGGVVGDDDTDCEEKTDSSDSAPKEIWYCVCLYQGLDI